MMQPENARRAESAPRSGSAILDVVLDTIGAIVVVLDREGRVVGLNRAGQDATGYSNEEVAGKLVWDLLLLPEELDKVRAVFNELCAGQFPNAAVNYWATKDGQRRLIAWSNTALLDAAGAVEYVVATGIDITERKRAEEALLESEAKYRSLTDDVMDSSAAGIFILDADFRVAWINRAMERFFGLAKEDVIGKDKRELIRARVKNIIEDGERFLDKVFATYDSNTYAERFECRVLPAEGREERWLEHRSQPIQSGRYAGGRIEHYYDITERKRAEEALARERNVLRTVMDHAPVFIFLKDTHSRFVTTNAEHLRLIGVDRLEEVVGKTDFDFFPRELAERYYADEQAVVRSGEPMFDREEPIRYKTGEERWVLTTKVPLRDETGTLVGIVGISRDITERREADESLRRAKQDAEAANAAKSNFLATMSHEIRTPLNAIIGITGLLLDTDLDPEQREHAEVVRSASESLLALVNDLLDVSRIEAGKLTLETKDFNLGEVIQSAAEIVAVKARQKSTELACMIPGDVPLLVRGDRGRLRQVMMNLLGNAVRFTEKGEVALSVSLERETGTHAAFRVAVSDTGIGIPEDQTHRLFQTFSQVEASTRQKHGGAGLGLAISKRLVEAMGGEIGFESEEGRGSTFWFTVELEKQPPGGLREPKSTADLEALARPHSPSENRKQSARLLLVEDNAINRKVAMKLLERHGYRADAVANGAEAVKALGAAPYDAVLMDVQMPEMDGLEATRIVRDRASAVRNHDIPIIAMTAYAMKGDRERCLAAGMNDYIPKPLELHRLAEMLKKWLPQTAPLGGTSSR